MNRTGVRRHGLWLAVILVGAFLLRAWNLSSQSLDVDEFTELERQHDTYTELAWAEDSMPPLYPLLLKSWLTVWPGEMAGRWLSVIIGVATIAVVGLLWEKCFGTALALVLAALLAISPLHIYYSQYVRSYGLMMFWTALAIGALALAVKSERKSYWLLFAVSALGGLYTHYYFAIFLAVLSLTFAIWAYGWKWSRQWWIANLCVGLLSLPLIAFIGEDLKFQKSLREPRPLDIPALGYTYVSMLTGYSIGPSKRDLQMLDKRAALVAALPIAIAVGGIFLSLGWLGWGYSRKQPLLRPCVVLALVPVLVIGLLGLAAGVTYNPRFVVWSLLPILALLAAGIVTGHRSWLGRVGIVALVAVSALAIHNRQSIDAYKNEDVRSLGTFLQGQVHAPVFVTANYMFPLVAHYLPSDWNVLELPTVEATDRMQSTSELVSLAHATIDDNLSPGNPFWLVYTRSFHGDPEGEILADLRETCALESVHETAGIVLYRGVLPAD